MQRVKCFHFSESFGNSRLGCLLCCSYAENFTQEEQTDHDSKFLPQYDLHWSACTVLFCFLPARNIKGLIVKTIEITENLRRSFQFCSGKGIGLHSEFICRNQVSKFSGFCANRLFLDHFDSISRKGFVLYPITDSRVK